MVLLIVVELLIFFASTGLALFVLLKDARNLTYQALASSAFGMAGWNLTIFLLLANIGDALLPGRLAFSFGILMTYGFAWFTLLYPKKFSGYKKIGLLFLPIAIISFVIPLLPDFVGHIEVVNGHIEGDLNQQLFGLWFLSFNGIMLLTAVFMIGRLFRLKGLDRDRLFQLFFGFGIFFLLSTTTNSILPIAFQDFRFNNLGPIFTLILLAFLANAVLQYRLLDIRWILGRSVFVSSIIAVIVWIVASVAFLLSSVVGSKSAAIVSALLVVLIYRPLWHGLEVLFDKFISFGAYDPKKATTELFELVRTEGDLQALTTKAEALLSGYFRADRCALFVLRPGTDRVMSGAKTGEGFMARGLDPILVTTAKTTKFEILETAELNWQIEYGSAKERSKNQKAIRALQASGIETLVPFVTDGRLVALLIFGSRSGGHQLYARDTEFLNLIRAGMSPALENAAKFEEIRGLYEKLSEADKVKSEFISVVSHRFRTPLSALRWNLETVLDTARVNKDAKQMLVDSQDRTEFLVNTLDGLFDALAIENGALKINKESFNIQKAIHPFVSVFERKIGEKGIMFHYSVPSMSIVGDQKRILFIVNTLLTNALQYTSVGDITLKVSKRDTNVAIEVSDTGVGIAPKEQEKVFEKFYRGKNAKSLNPDGQGLGLYLVKQLAQLHKGRVELESTSNKGTKITVLLPIK